MHADKLNAPWQILIHGVFPRFVEAVRMLDPDKGYHKNELAQVAGISEANAYNKEYTERAVDLGLLEESNGLYYRNEDSDILEHLTALNEAVDAKMSISTESGDDG